MKTSVCRELSPGNKLTMYADKLQLNKDFYSVTLFLCAHSLASHRIP